MLVAGPLRLDLRDHRLWLDGEAVRLGGKALALVERLMRTPQRLVTKDELFDVVWGGLAVSDSVLTTAVKEARQALGDDARRPRFIETVHGRGYRLLSPPAGGEDPPPVEATAEPAASIPRRRTPLIAAGVATVLAVAALLVWAIVARPWTTTPMPHAKSVAVLPFEDLSPDHGAQWFADGLTEEVLSTLARTRDLRVTARLPAGEDPAAAARSRAVAHVLVGSVRRSGDRVRVTVDLVRTSDGEHVWSESYDRSGGDIISIQQDVGVHIAQALKTATDPAKLRAMAAAGTRSVEAYEAYLRGLALSRRQLEEGDVAFSRAAAEAYEEARRLDPGFAAAHWRSAQTWFGNATRVDSRAMGDGLTDRARLAGFVERIDAAIANSPDTTESLKYRAQRAVMQLHFRQAQRLMAQYLAARPRDTSGWEDMAQISAYAGDRQAMVRAARRFNALSLEAGDPRSRAVTLLVMAGRFDEAAALGRRLATMRPDSALVLYQTHRALLWSGDVKTAHTYLDRLERTALPASSKALAELRQACAERRISDAETIYRRLWASPKSSSRFNAAEMFGDEQAIKDLLSPLDTPDRLPTLMQFMIYPTFDARAFPNLRAALDADGVVPLRPIAVPARCPPRRATAAT
jgi:TolB-like protein/DNA-binding winged helix-turn-helix (wHTH) protein